MSVEIVLQINIPFISPHLSHSTSECRPAKKMTHTALFPSNSSYSFMMLKIILSSFIYKITAIYNLGSDCGNKLRVSAVGTWEVWKFWSVTSIDFVLADNILLTFYFPCYNLACSSEVKCLTKLAHFADFYLWCFSISHAFFFNQ